MNYKSLNDYELIYMVRESDDSSRNILYEKYMPIISSVSSDYYLKYKDFGCDYDDFLQEAMIGFQKALVSYDENRDNLFYTFVIVCIHRRLLSFCRAFMNKKNKSNILNVSIDDISCIDERENLDSILTEREMEKELKTVIFDLAWEEGLIFELRMNGFHYVEIGELLDISPRRVGAISRQIRNIVKGKINQYYFK